MVMLLVEVNTEQSASLSPLSSLYWTADSRSASLVILRILWDPKVNYYVEISNFSRLPLCGPTEIEPIKRKSRGLILTVHCSELNS
jgi:hypothetical protein